MAHIPKKCPKSCPCGNRPLPSGDELKFGGIFGFVFKDDQENFIVRHAVSTTVFKKGLPKKVLATLGSLHSKLYSRDYLEEHGFADKIYDFVKKYHEHCDAGRSFEVSGKKVLFFPGSKKGDDKGKGKSKDKGKGKEKAQFPAPQDSSDYSEDIAPYCSDVYQDSEDTGFDGPSPFSLAVVPSSSGSSDKHHDSFSSNPFSVNEEPSNFMMEIPIVDLSPASSESAKEESNIPPGPSSEESSGAEKPAVVFPMEVVVVPQEPVPQEPVPQEPVPQEPVPQEPVPQEPAPQEPAPQEPAPAPQEPAPAPQEPAPAPQEPAPAPLEPEDKKKDKKKSKKRSHGWTKKKSKKAKKEVKKESDKPAPAPKIKCKKAGCMFPDGLLGNLREGLDGVKSGGK